MARSGRYKVPFRRRREGKTNYYKRKRLVVSRRLRAAVRISNKYVLGQIIEAQLEGDKTIVYANSKELVKSYGWKAGTKNIPAAYLTGYLLAKRASEKGIKDVILDIGLHVPIAGNRVFAFLKGLADGGLEVPHSEDVYPDETRVRGEHIAEYAKYILENENLGEEYYKKRFSQYLAKGLKPEELPKHFDEVLKKIS